MEDGGKPKKLCVQINYKLLLLTEEMIISLVTLYDNYNERHWTEFATLLRFYHTSGGLCEYQ